MKSVQNAYLLLVVKVYLCIDQDYFPLIMINDSVSRLFGT